MENLNDILLKSKMLFNYDPKKTLTENTLKKSLDEVSLPLNENAGMISALDDLARRAGAAGETAIKNMGDDVLRHMPGAEIKMTRNGQSIFVKSGDEFLNQLKAGATLSRTESQVLAKNLMKTPLPPGSSLRNSLTDKASDLVLRDARYANMSGDDIARELKRKGYNRDIADEIGKKARQKGAGGGRQGGGQGNRRRGGGNQGGGQGNRRRGGGNQGGGNQGGGQGNRRRGGQNQPLNQNNLVGIKSVLGKHWKYIEEMYRKGATRAYVRKWVIGMGLSVVAFMMFWNWLTGEHKEHSCPDGFYWDGDKCVKIPITEKCPAGTHWDGSKCVPDGPVPPPKICTDFPYTKGCKSPIIAEVQNCLRISADGIFGNQTLNALNSGGYGNSITKEVYDKIKSKCGSNNDNTTTTTTSDIINIVDPTEISF